MDYKVLYLTIALSILAVSLAAPAETTEPKDLAPEKGDLQTAASHWGGHYGGWGHYGGYGGHGVYGGYGGYGYPHYGYWGWPSYGYWYGHGWPYGYGHGYWL